MPNRTDEEQRLQAEIEQLRARVAELETRHAETEAQAELFATLARSSPVGIFRTDPGGDCVFVNDKWCEISGMTSAQAAGNGWVDQADRRTV